MTARVRPFLWALWMVSLSVAASGATPTNAAEPGKLQITILYDAFGKSPEV